MDDMQRAETGSLAQRMVFLTDVQECIEFGLYHGLIDEATAHELVDYDVDTAKQALREGLKNR